MDGYIPWARRSTAFTASNRRKWRLDNEAPRAGRHRQRMERRKKEARIGHKRRAAAAVAHGAGLLRRRRSTLDFLAARTTSTTCWIEAVLAHQRSLPTRACANAPGSRPRECRM